VTAPPDLRVIDDLTRDDGLTAAGTGWALISDGVMGGVSSGTLRRGAVAGRPALHLQGSVRLDNNDGFLQIAADLAPGGGAFDATGWTGLAIDLCGPAESYGLHLRTTDLTRPWQSFRADLTIGPDWQRHFLPFTAFQPHRTDVALTPARLRRVGLISIGRAFGADVAMGGLWLYRDAVSLRPAR
jgi:hypothetical protein